MNCLTPTENDDGATAVEYGLIIFAIAALIAVVVYLFGDLVLDLFRGSCDTLRSQAATSTTCS